MLRVSIVRQVFVSMEVASLQVALPAKTAADEFAEFCAAHPAEVPRLGPADYQVVGPTNHKLNCHCAAVGMAKGFETPGASIAEADAWFATKGFEPLEPLEGGALDLRRDLRREKVVLYALHPAVARMLLRDEAAAIGFDMQSTLALASQTKDELYPTHSVSQTLAGSWRSKMGTGPTIEFGELRALADGAYGRPVRVYGRSRRHL